MDTFISLNILFYSLCKKTTFFVKGKSLKQQLQEIIGNQKEMMQGITSLKKDVSTIKGEMEKRKANEPVEIPSKIRVSHTIFYRFYI